MKALGAAIEALESVVNGSRAGYRTGIRINSNVLDAQRERYAAQQNWARAEPTASDTRRKLADGRPQTLLLIRDADVRSQDAPRAKHAPARYVEARDGHSVGSRPAFWRAAPQRV